MAEEWAGDRAAQRRGTKRILRAIEGMHPVDAMASLGTVVANTVSDCSRSRADAESGFDAACGDMRDVIHRRFPEVTIQ